MSVYKSQASSGQYGTKPRAWTMEYIITGLLKLILNMAFFFTFIYIGETQWNIRRDYLINFLYIFGFYVASGIVSFSLSYIIVKLLFGRFLHRQVKDIRLYLKGKFQRKKLWIYILSIGFQTIFFIMSIVMILADRIPLPDTVAYILAWLILRLVAKVLGRVLYFLLYIM